ncbi:MAG: ligase-associated DNA damage response endonuclease PdeM [Pseudomonadota bacterium]
MGHAFKLGQAQLEALETGCLWWAGERLLCVSDMHLGKASRFARRTGGLLPPFETHETLARLAQEIARFDPETVICLGDSFDDLQALDEVEETDLKSLMALMAGREWIWIEGNHEAGPTEISGTHLKEYARRDIVFRHIYHPDDAPQISGHYHPKGRLSAGAAGRSAPCFVLDKAHMIMPAFGTYTGGLKVSDPAIQAITTNQAIGVMTGQKTLSAPLSKL